MKKVFVVLLAAVLLLGAVSIALPSTATTAAAAGTSSGSIVFALPQKLHNALRAFFGWLLRLLRFQKESPVQPEPEQETAAPPNDRPSEPQDTSAQTPSSDETDLTEPTSGTTLICDSEPSTPTQGSTEDTPTGESGTTMPSSAPGSHCDYEPSGSTTPPSGENG